MGKSYDPQNDVDEIIARQATSGDFTSADSIVGSAAHTRKKLEADTARLRARIDDSNSAYGRGALRKSPGAEAMTADIISRGEARLRRKS